MNRVDQAKKSWMLAVVFMIGFFTGCSARNDVRPESVSDALQKEAVRVLIGQYPDRFKVRHRAILTLNDKDYVLNGFIAVDREKGDVRLVAVDDLGGTVFDVGVAQNRKPEIHCGIRSMKPEWLEQTLVRDLLALYMQDGNKSDSGFEQKNGDLILHRVTGDIQEQLIFNTIRQGEGTVMRLSGIRHLKPGRPVYKIEYTYGSVNERYPGFVEISDPGMRYSMKIQVQYFMADNGPL